jgi:nicotinate phosphoribosyltransferase
MAAGYFENRFEAKATFELFVREMPINRSFLVSAGLEQVIEYLLNLKFDAEDIEYLKQLPSFSSVSKEFFNFLSKITFSGDVWAISEGEIFFPGEPLIRVTAPIIQAQIIETFLLSVMNFQCMVASKSARVVHAAQCDGKKRGIMEFGSRQAHGPEAGVYAARASYIAGCMGTSNVYAGKSFDIPVYGTAAHSWTMAFESEMESFEAYRRVFPDSTILLIDTYNVEEGAKNAVKLNKKFSGVRIDSGDLLEYSRMVRRILDENGYEDTIIVASGDLDEFKIKDLVENNGPINSFGVGTKMITSEDAPSLGGIYKLVEIEKSGNIKYKAKFSDEKATYPGKKQVYRILDNNENYVKDVIGLEKDQIPEKHETLLKEIINKGKLVYEFPDMETLQNNFKGNFRKLNNSYKRFENPETYPVKYSKNLQQLFNELKKKQ